jgi:hypothetical protein
MITESRFGTKSCVDAKALAASAPEVPRPRTLLFDSAATEAILAASYRVVLK